MLSKLILIAYEQNLDNITNKLLQKFMLKMTGLEKFKPFNWKSLMVLILLVSIGVAPVDGKEKWKGKRKAYPLTPEITKEIVSRAKYYGLPPLMVLEVMRQESSFNPNACSSANARGLMQFIPSTARRFGISNPHDISQSIDAGCRYLSFLIRKFDGRLDLVLAGYNAGEGAVERWGNRVPPYEETQNYVRTIIANYKRALAVKEAFLKQNNITVVQAQVNHNQSRARAVSSYKTSFVVSKKPLTKKQLQQKLKELDDFSRTKKKLIAVK